MNLNEPCVHGHDPDWRVIEYRKNGVVKGKTRMCRACQRAKYVPKPHPRPPRRTRPAISASAANASGLSCKRGHVGTWTDNGATRCCTSCRLIRQAKSRYGLTEQQARALFDDADGRCQSCGERRPLCVDHCHTTGAVRGLICTRCNNFAGVLEHPSIVHVRAYLDRASKRAEIWQT